MLQQQQLRRPHPNHQMAVRGRLMLFALAAAATLFGIWIWPSASRLFGYSTISSKTPLRVFGPALHDGRDFDDNDDNKRLRFSWFNHTQQRDFLVNNGKACQKVAKNRRNRSAAVVDEDLLLRRFDVLPESMATELWKYCVLYTGVGNVYVDRNNLQLLETWEDLLLSSSFVNNVAIQLARGDPDEEDEGEPIHLSHSFLQIVRPRSRVATNMLRLLLTTPLFPAVVNGSSDEARLMLRMDPMRLSESLAAYVSLDLKKQQPWNLLLGRCLWAGHSYPSNVPLLERRARGQACPVAAGHHCCQVWKPAQQNGFASLMIRDPFLQQQNERISSRSEGPFIASVREQLTGEEPADPTWTPNFFDILAENDCLPKGRECFRCLKLISPASSTADAPTSDSTVIDPLAATTVANMNACRNQCHQHCSCYCSVLCQFRPPPKPIVARWWVTPPNQVRLYNDKAYLIPRIIHQTWYEPITKEKYPNMSRLIESFRKMGWEYKFYDDDAAAEFISQHFPVKVRQAYDAILPGAFKADLFRYCVLLIRGGVYSDMDVLLESNLNHVLQPNVGFLTAQDEPGRKDNARSCLWNGFMASAPGHPFLMQTIETVVNNIHNRFTSVDYDDMLCPNPVLSVSHTTDMLFTCGPCILGASINRVLKRHPQTSFDYGDMELFETERKLMEQQEQQPPIDANDLRLHIPGRSILLKQSKNDMGAHRFTYVSSGGSADLVVASTDLPNYDDRPPSVHYSKTHEKFGIYGLEDNKLYHANHARANAEIRIAFET